MNLIEQLQSKQERKKELESLLVDPGVLSDLKKLRQVNEEYSEIKAIVDIGEKYSKVLSELQETREMLNEEDEEIRVMAENELVTLEAKIPILEKEFSSALLPPDPLDKKNVIVEIRAGTGGDESALFASEMFRMYNRYAEQQGWKTNLISSNQNDLGGFKEIIFSVKGTGVYGFMKYEAGVHRVQRVPETEKQGRVHTSTVTVAVLHEVEDEDFHIDPKDLKIEASTSQGAGGQSVNTAYSAIRIVHIPTGIEVRCQDERSQTQNKQKALEVIRARVFAYEEEKKRRERSEQIKSQVGSGERSEKIRTYNFPQDRVTDHRIKMNWHGLLGIMEGNIGEIITELKQADIEEKMRREA